MGRERGVDVFRLSRAHSGCRRSSPGASDRRSDGGRTPGHVLPLPEEALDQGEGVAARVEI